MLPRRRLSIFPTPPSAPPPLPVFSKSICCLQSICIISYTHCWVIISRRWGFGQTLHYRSDVVAACLRNALLVDVKEALCKIEYTAGGIKINRHGDSRGVEHERILGGGLGALSFFFFFSKEHVLQEARAYHSLPRWSPHPRHTSDPLALLLLLTQIEFPPPFLWFFHSGQK